MTDSTVLDVEQIKKLLPHRAPMLFVEKLADIVPNQSATGYKAVSINEPFFMGHFPQRAVMPGVLIVEAMAQTAGALVVHSQNATVSSAVYFMTIEKARFRKPVGPGDLLRMPVKALRRRGLQTLDLSDNELAKLHVRHMVGGHLPKKKGAVHELLYRFEFPERRGALMKFLSSMNPGWNISLFHYRNHGADYGRVLVGMEVPPKDKAKFKAFLADVGYPCADESRNPAYRLFLS
jgi:beta-hydroxyacyl-ACP dehydratase FabZ